MKVSEMNAHYNALYRIMGELTSQLIGCYENSMMDDEKDSEEYKEDGDIEQTQSYANGYTGSMKADYIGKTYDKNGYAVHLFYRYRGREYMITDERNGYSEPLFVKHQNEQKRIDREIEAEQASKKEVAYEETADYGIDLFMKQTQ